MVVVLRAVDRTSHALENRHGTRPVEPVIRSGRKECVDALSTVVPGYLE
jgi:hypothetical protein